MPSGHSHEPPSAGKEDFEMSPRSRGSGVDSTGDGLLKNGAADSPPSSEKSRQEADEDHAKDQTEPDGKDGKEKPAGLGNYFVSRSPFLETVILSGN